jgi:hypothetical protein
MNEGMIALLVERKIWSSVRILEFGLPAKKRDTSVGVYQSSKSVEASLSIYKLQECKRTQQSGLRRI